MATKPPKKPAPRPSAKPAVRKPAKPASASVPAAAKAGDQNGTRSGERIAKVLARAGVASRREAEKLIELGQVAVNGLVIDSPALNVTEADKITVDGKPLAAAEPSRLWLYYKPIGLVTSERDEKGRETVFDSLPEELPRVLSIGRLDLNSEGLLLLTNDGELKRRLELPSTGWLRKYRVRVNGQPTEEMLEPLRKGLTVDGERFQGMTVTIDKIQGANAWLTVGIREGKNREIRRAINHVGLIVNRLIRVSYGPFKLGVLEPGQVEEIKARVLRDQLGTGEVPEGTAKAKVKHSSAGRPPGKPKPPTGPRPAGGKPARSGASRPTASGHAATGRAASGLAASGPAASGPARSGRSPAGRPPRKGPPRKGS